MPERTLVVLKLVGSRVSANKINSPDLRLILSHGKVPESARYLTQQSTRSRPARWKRFPTCFLQYLPVLPNFSKTKLDGHLNIQMVLTLKQPQIQSTSNLVGNPIDNQSYRWFSTGSLSDLYSQLSYYILDYEFKIYGYDFYRNVVKLSISGISHW